MTSPAHAPIAEPDCDETWMKFPSLSRLAPLLPADVETRTPFELA